jgi:hypothetical protein
MDPLQALFDYAQSLPDPAARARLAAQFAPSQQAQAGGLGSINLANTAPPQQGGFAATPQQLQQAQQINQTVNVPPSPRDPFGLNAPQTDEERGNVRQAGWSGAAAAVAPMMNDWRTTPAGALAAAVAGYGQGAYGARQDVAAGRKDAMSAQLTGMQVTAAQKALAEKEAQKAAMKQQAEALPPDLKQKFNLLMSIGEADQAGKLIAPDPTEVKTIGGSTEGHFERQPDGSYKNVIPGMGFNPNSGTKVTAPININMPGQKQADKVQEWFGEQFGATQKAAGGAQTNLAKLGQLSGLLKGIETGKFTPGTTEFKAALKGAGVDLGSLGLTDDVAPIQAATALINQMVLDARSTADGGGMPGSMSEQDRIFLQGINPSVSQTTEGRNAIIDFATKLEKRKIENARRMRDYVAKNKAVDQGYYDEADEFATKNPLSPPVVSPDEARKLPPGTMFMTQDGRIMTR